jgi:hypothetical protein
VGSESNPCGLVGSLFVPVVAVPVVAHIETVQPRTRVRQPKPLAVMSP